MTVDLYDVARALLDPSTADMRVLAAIASGAVLIAAILVVLVRRRDRRPTVAELADPAYNPRLDRSEARLRAALTAQADDDTEGLTIPPPPWRQR